VPLLYHRCFLQTLILDWLKARKDKSFGLELLLTDLIMLSFSVLMLLQPSQTFFVIVSVSLRFIEGFIAKAIFSCFAKHDRQALQERRQNWSHFDFFFFLWNRNPAWPSCWRCSI